MRIIGDTSRIIDALLESGVTRREHRVVDSLPCDYRIGYERQSQHRLIAYIIAFPNLICIDDMVWLGWRAMDRAILSILIRDKEKKRNEDYSQSEKTQNNKIHTKINCT